MLLFSILPFLALAAASPIQKRFNGVKIQAGRNGKCLSPVSANYANGVQVTTVGCDQAHRWDINPGSGSVILTGTNFALDAGTGADNNEIVKLWQSYPGLFQQTWYLTDDRRIAITGGNQCLDEGDNGPQTYQCTTGNTNQVWNIVDIPTVTTSTSHMTTTTPTVSSTVSVIIDSSGGLIPTSA
ncbi:uncharacterized protein L203_102811 [Cryptococcus depauperatus CBS 7841]|uniref:Uncharacterized protein n=1 Tax=Cryptococcus depauperatus CBS 7841 TaxID=1295531 RepID=A0A1E3IB91_9TREE|nr:hypothetical protein L203_04612 [Cryptococcus depauperatus CBS 7841]